MAKVELELNRFIIELTDKPEKIYFHSEKELREEKYYMGKYKPTSISEWKFLNKNKQQVEQCLKKENIRDESFVYISFFKENNNSCDIEFQKLPYTFQKKYIKEILIKNLLPTYIIEPSREGVDFSIYSNINENGQNKYVRFDVVLSIYNDSNKNIKYEAIVGVGSTDTYLIKIQNSHQIDYIKKHCSSNSLKFVGQNLLIKQETNDKIDEIFNYPVKANFKIRKMLNIVVTPRRKFYKEYFNLINEFIKTISEKMDKSLKLSTAFSRIIDTNLVSIEKNKMVFRNKNEDFTTVNGMRDYGPYMSPGNIKETQLLFIYPDVECVEKLFNFFTRGYRHFPGLESYVGMPANLYKNSIKYDIKLETIPEKINEVLTENKYSNVLAVCIMPFSKSTATENESKIYYDIKKTLLAKNIPSQFIYRTKIFEENFHFSLPNIAIAMFAKCGGIPWKLANPHYKQLTVGFNIYSNNEKKTFLGSTVFFDNEGVIREVNVNKGNSIDDICNSLVKSIINYKETLSQTEIVNKIIIHFYKSVARKELERIEDSIKNHLGEKTNFAIVEINDTRTSVELCFDLNYNTLMPQSGTYIKLKPNEYLLFNNLRYWEKPTNPIGQEELPVKLRIFDPYKSFDSNELIGQVYEFSRMYWKSLKQKAQPVTIVYSKLIANYIAGFGGVLPDTEVARKTVWFI